MASYDGTNKSSAGCAQHLPYWEIRTEYTRSLYNEAMGQASPEAIKFCDPDGYNGPEVEVDASTLTDTFLPSLVQMPIRRTLTCIMPRRARNLWSLSRKHPSRD